MRREPDPRNVARVYTNIFREHGLQEAEEIIDNEDEYIKSLHAAHRLKIGVPINDCIHVDDDCNQPPCIGCTMKLD